MARSDVDQILARKERWGTNRAAMELSSAVERLEREWLAIRRQAAAFTDFIPMRLVTLIEVFVREVIREIVDYGPPYLDRAEKLAKGARIDFIFASNLQGRKLSIGDLVAHSIPVNSPTNIIAAFEGLIPDFTASLKLAHPRWSEEVDTWPQPPVIQDFDLTLATLTKLFEVRHILTHEFPQERPYESNEIVGFLAAARELLSAIDWVIVDKLKGSVPQTQIMMNIQAGNSLIDLEAQMKGLLQAVSDKQDVSSELLETSQIAWLEYADREADLHASLVEGGSMHSMVWASAKSDLVRHRIDELQWWINREEGDL
ncbi:lysozyme inhibitor LprI family protein [Mesorhizobium australicum]|uniref:Uncharacterized conserved protein YecT, DUF1311 family n=1 Tax=Mesorhizobium australicum TaxID=536018 RepID=A0A1X7NTA4_9HYPH|nr:lysozyme inhibitor LprI family protein [Mesorhizobium australicum]SMH41282.1 Uncharacterized conserved protein YecT, DUF1311 family [Mesorhizobium australicum]